MTPWEQIAGEGALAMVLVRHGRTAWNAERRFLGATDLPLDEVGLDEVSRLSAAAGGTFDAVYASPLQRARQTAAALGAPSGDIRLVEALREVGQGVIEGLTGEIAAAEHPDFFRAFAADPTDVRIPGGETFREARDRAFEALREIAAAHGPGERLAVVTHQVIISTVLCTLAEAPLGEWRRFGLPNTGAAILAWDGGSPRIAIERWTGGDRIRGV